MPKSAASLPQPCPGRDRGPRPRRLRRLRGAEGNRLRLPRRRHLPARPGQPERGLQPDRQRDHQLRGTPGLVAGRQTPRLRRQVPRHPRREHLLDGTRRAGTRPSTSRPRSPTSRSAWCRSANSPGRRTARRSPSCAAAQPGQQRALRGQRRRHQRQRDRNPDRRRRRHPDLVRRTAARSPSGTATRSTPSPATSAARRRRCPGPPATNRPGPRTAARSPAAANSRRPDLRPGRRHAPDDDHQQQPVRLPLLVAERRPARLPRQEGENTYFRVVNADGSRQPCAAGRPGPERRTARRVLVTRRHPPRLPGLLLRRPRPPKKPTRSTSPTPTAPARSPR